MYFKTRDQRSKTPDFEFQPIQMTSTLCWPVNLSKRKVRWMILSFWPKKGFLVPKKELQRDSPVAVLTPEHTNLKSSRFFYRRKEKYWALMNLDRLPWRLLPSYAPSFHEICWKRSLSSAQSPHFFLVRSASFLDCLYSLQLLVALRDFVGSQKNDGIAWFLRKGEENLTSPD